MDTPRRTRTYRSHHLDSERWDHVTLRPGDVVISTSMKAGTTWMQRIMSLLVFGPGPLPAPLVALSPWIDAAFLGDVDDVVATIEAQEHQRFLKSHLPFDALPYDPAVRYVYVGRDTRDVFMSAFNHYSGYTEFTYSLLDAAGGAGGPMPRCPATERELWADWMTRSLFDWETDGWPFWSHHHHAASFWPYRDLPNVLMVHYADLLADLEAQMRRVAAFTQLEVAEDAWPELVAAARFDAMKQDAIRNEEHIGPTSSRAAPVGSSTRAPTDAGAMSSPRRTWPSTRQQPRGSTRSCAHGSKPAQHQRLTPALDASRPRTPRPSGRFLAGDEGTYCRLRDTRVSHSGGYGTTPNGSGHSCQRRETVRVLWTPPDPPLQASDFTLRRFRREDAASIVAACADREIPRFTFMKEGLNLSEAEQWVERSNAGWDAGHVRFAIAGVTNGLLGQIGFAANDHYRSAEAYYWLSAAARGRGIATRALSLVADWAFEGGIERLFLLVHPENEPSHRVAQRCGFSREGVLRAFERFKGERADLVSWSLLLDDPRPSRQ